MDLPPSDQLMDQVESMGMKAVAITDHGTMFGVVDFYKEAKKKFQTIIGCEVYTAPDQWWTKTLLQTKTRVIWCYWQKISRDTKI
jgi:DNA polymerase III subunit alpha